MSIHNYLPNNISIIENDRTIIEIGNVSMRLLQEINLSTSKKMIEIFSASGVFGVIASKQNPKLETCEFVTNIQDKKTVSKIFDINGIKNGCVFPITDLFAYKNEVDAVVIRTVLEKRKSLIIKSAIFAASLLKGNGQLFLVGAKNEGVQSIAKQLSKIFLINSETVQYKQGVHLIKFSFPLGFKRKIDGKEEDDVQEYDINGVSLKLITDENVFAKGKLDSATKLLLENLIINDSDKILDLGCGSGVIGLFASKKAKDVRVTLVDNDYISIKTAERNLILNKVNNYQLFVSDGLSEMKEGLFNCIISNPPFHQGREISHLVAERFIRESYKYLLPGGKLYIVCNIFLAYEKIFKEIYNDSKIIAKNKSFKVILGVKK